MGDKFQRLTRKVTDTFDVELIGDTRKGGTQSIHLGYFIASFKHAGKDGTVVASNGVSVTWNGRTWLIPLTQIVSLAITADEELEKETPCET